MPIDRKQPSSCRTTAPAPLFLLICLSTCPYLIPKATLPQRTSRPPAFFPLREFAVDCTGYDMHASISVPMYGVVCASVVSTFEGRTGGEPDPPGWSNPDNRRTLNEREPLRESRVRLSNDVSKPFSISFLQPDVFFFSGKIFKFSVFYCFTSKD